MNDDDFCVFSALSNLSFTGRRVHAHRIRRLQKKNGQADRVLRSVWPSSSNQICSYAPGIRYFTTWLSTAEEEPLKLTVPG